MPAQNTNALGQAVGFAVPDWHPCGLPSRVPMNGQFCRLEALQPETHARDLFAANALDIDGRMWTYLPYGPFESYANYLTWLQTIGELKDPMFYAILDQRTNEARGLCAFQRIDPANGSIEAGHIAFSPGLQRTPAATEAMFLMMENAFALGYRRYEWKCNALNLASRKAAQRLGFSFEGVFRHAAVVKGCNRDTAWYSIIDSEWPALKAAFLRWLAPENFDEGGAQRLSLSFLTEPLLQNHG